MDWLLENVGVIGAVATIVFIVAIVLLQRYKGKRDRLYADLEVILRDGLEFMKGWSGDRMQEVTEEEVHKVANKFFDDYVAGKLVAAIITRERLRGVFWQRFCQWRDWFTSFEQALALEP